MNENKLKQLFDVARNEAPPAVPFDFHRSVSIAVSRAGRLPNRVSLGEQLGMLFPRIAIAAAVVVTLCTAAELYMDQNEASLSATVEQVAADEWLIAGK